MRFEIGVRTSKMWAVCRKQYGGWTPLWDMHVYHLGYLIINFKKWKNIETIPIGPGNVLTKQHGNFLYFADPVIFEDKNDGGLNA